MAEYWKTEAYRECVRTSCESVADVMRLKDARVLVTGASGLVGSFLADVLGAAGCDVFVAGRKPGVLKERFPYAQVLYYDLKEEIGFRESLDYVIHCAGYGHPAAFREDPSGLLLNSVNGTARLLQYATEHQVKRLLYVSSGEVYGGVDAMTSRACYPIGKQAGENLCASYFEQHGLGIVVARLCHTFGPGMEAHDNRAATQFFQSAMRGEDIVLKSKGEQRRSYLFVADAASAMLSLLTAGDSGKAYDIAAADCVTRIADLAELIAGAAGVGVRYELPNESETKEQSPIPEQILDGNPLKELGWKPAYSIRSGVDAMMRFFIIPRTEKEEGNE